MTQSAVKVTGRIVRVDMGKLARDSGKSEAELAITILSVLAVRASVTGVTQHVTMSFPKGAK